jgi:hypothetical protein
MLRQIKSNEGDELPQKSNILTLHIQSSMCGVGLWHELVEGPAFNAAARVSFTGVDGHHANRVNKLLFRSWVTAHKLNRKSGF